MNRTMLDVDGDPRLNLVAFSDARRRAVIVDITIPFENRYASFKKAGRLMISKYAGVKEEFKCKRYRVFVDALLVGALGSWEPANDVVL